MLRRGIDIRYVVTSLQESDALGRYQVIRFLPPRKDGESEYQIKHLTEGHERVARESELRSA
jgi:hypothetical protein